MIMRCSLQAAGADALELNLSCPHGMGERGMGLACGQVCNSYSGLVHLSRLFIKVNVKSTTFTTGPRTGKEYLSLGEGCSKDPLLCKADTQCYQHSRDC